MPPAGPDLLSGWTLGERTGYSQRQLNHNSRALDHRSRRFKGQPHIAKRSVSSLRDIYPYRGSIYPRASPIFGVSRYWLRVIDSGTVRHGTDIHERIYRHVRPRECV